jgi:hypothetical protein
LSIFPSVGTSYQAIAPEFITFLSILFFNRETISEIPKLSLTNSLSSGVVNSDK